eukprot:PITA_14992
MDVKTEFLNGTINEEVYIEKPLGFEVKDREAYVCRLKKALYDLKQAPRAWYARMDPYLQRLGFTKSSTYLNLYIKVVKDEPIIILLYVDDLLLTSVEGRIQECKKQLVAKFNMKDLGLVHYYLGQEVWRGPDEIYLGQGNQFRVELKHDHWIAAKHILRFLQGTTNYFLKYDKGNDVHLIGYTDYDWGGTCEASKEVVWLRELLSDLFEGPMDPTMIHCDNTSGIRLSEDPMFHGKTKHINNKYHHIRKLVQDGVLQLRFISTNEQVVDILTKSLPNMKLLYLRDKLGLVDISSLVERER